MTSLDDLRAHQDALKAKFGPTESIAYADASKSQFSIARFYGACKINGEKWLYNDSDDSLIREDVSKFVSTLKKKEKKNEKQRPATPDCLPGRT